MEGGLQSTSTDLNDLKSNWSSKNKTCGGDVAGDIETCANSSEGLESLKKVGALTPKDHQYVPWLVINGEHNSDEENSALSDLKSFLCSKNQGHPGCSSNVPVDFKFDNINMTFEIAESSSNTYYEKPPCTNSDEFAVEIQ